MPVFVRVHSPARVPLRRMALYGVVIFTMTAAALVAALSVATPAMAHNYYLESTPAIGEVLTTLPEDFVVTTNDNLLNLDGATGGSFMKVTGPDGLYYGDGCVTVNGPSASMPAALGPAGDYTLDWQVLSTDGHTVSDTIPFRWQPAEGEESTTEGSSTVPNCGAAPLTAPDEPGGKLSDNAASDILWISVAVIAVALAVVATMLLLRPTKKYGAQQPRENSPEEVPDLHTPDEQTPKK